MKNLRIVLLLSLWVMSSSRLPAQLTPADEPEFYGTDIYFHDWNQTNHTIDGYDWSVPDWVEPAPNSAIMHTRKIYGKPADEMLLAAGFRGNLKRVVSWNWKKIEPTEGEYDWQSLRDEIDRVSENGKYRVELRIYAAVIKYDAFNDDGTPAPTPASSIEIEQSAPEWLKDKGIATILGQRYLNFQLTYYDEYDDKYHDPYIKMIEALGRTGIFNDSRMINAYVHFGSSTRGEEGHGPALDSPNRPKYEERLAVWAAAAGADKHKLMTVSNEVKDLPVAYALGIGQRNAFVENYVLHSYNPELGTRVDSEGYMEIDESHPLIKDGLASGDENEEYFLTQFMEDRFGDFSTFKHRYMESTLRVLQMRRTTLWCQNVQGFINPPIRQFAALSLAKDVESTADAWTYLRQTNLKPNDGRTKYVQQTMAASAVNADGSLPVKNFERWLYQRDGGDIKTIPTRKRGEGGLQRARDPRHEYDYTARRTDLDNGHTKIGFALDDRFISGRGEVALKVSYVDDGNNEWYLSYTNTAGETVRKEITNSGTDQMRTVTWILRDIDFRATGMDNDFYLVAERGDLTASFIRVVKLAPGSSSSPPPSSPSPSDELRGVDGPQAVTPGNSYAVTVDYSATTNRDLVVQFKSADIPSVAYGYTRVSVPAGSGTVDIEVEVDGDTPSPASGYHWLSFLLPSGGTWSENLGVAVEANVAVGANSAATYAIRNVETNLYLRPANADQNSNIMVATNDHSSWFKWEKVETEEGYYYLKNVQTGQYFRPADDDEASLMLQKPTDWDGYYTQWGEVASSDGANVHLVNRATGNYIRPVSKVDTAVEQRPDHWNGPWTQWVLESTSGSRTALSKVKTAASSAQSSPMLVYPNAVDDVLNIASQRAIARLLIYDLRGQLRLSTQKVENTLSTAHLADGLYTLKVIFTDGSITSRKLIVQH